MKSVAILLVILALAAVPALAQEHPREKKASGELDIGMAVKVGSYTLEPGKYRLACDRKEITITRLSDDKKVAGLPCKGRELEKKADTTELYSDLDQNGVRVATKLLIRGSTVEHTF